MKKKWIAMPLFMTLFSLMTIKVVKDQLYVNKIEKKFLLNGTLYKSDDSFNYYELQDEKYQGKLAVSLKADKTTGTFEIPSKYDEKDVVGIYSYGFANRNNISVTIPDTIQVIDYEAFFNTNFTNTKITIPYSVKEMGTAAFFHTNIQNLIFSDGIEENVGVCQDTQTVEENTEKPVSQLKEIPDFCFAKCRDLSLISFSNSLESIKEEAFEYCSSLKTVAFLSGLKSLGNRAFNCCSSLKEVYLPSTILSTSNTSSIGEYCFTYCDGNLNFKLSMDKNDYQTFSDKNINWNRKGELNSDQYGCSFITGDVYANGSWLYNLQTVDNVQSVNLIRFIGKMEADGNMAFPDKINGLDVTSFSSECIPSEYQDQIQHIFFPSKLKSIPDNFFNDQQYSKLTYIGSMSGNNCYSTSTIKQNTIDLSSLKNLTTIGSSSFCFKQNKRSEFKTLMLPANLETIKDSAFSNFNYVTDFSIDYLNRSNTNSLTIGENAFFSLGYYSSIDNKNYIKAGNRGTVNLVLPKETTSISKQAFMYANCLNSLIILGGTTKINLTLDEKSFNDCNNLQKVVIQDRKANATSYSKVTLGQRCFSRWNCNVYNNPEGLDYRDYSYKPGLQVVYLPNGVVLNGTEQFDRQIRVSVYFGGNKIDLSKSKLFNEQIQKGSFGNTDALGHNTSKTQFKFDCPIPVYENVSYGIYDPDFSSKNYVLFDQGLNEGNEVNNCAYLLNKKDKTAILTKYRFDMQDKADKKGATVIIPDKINFNNEDYKVTEIGDSAFASSDSYDFYNNGNKDSDNANRSNNTFRTIKTLYLPDSITRIGKYAFFRCAGLATVQKSSTNTSVPSSLKEIGDLAFAFSGLTQLLNLNANCKVSTDVNIPSPFLNCPNLEKVTINSSSSSATGSLTADEKALFDSNGNVLTVFPKYSYENNNNDTNFSFPLTSTKFHFGAFKAVGWIKNMTVSSSNFSTDSQALFVGFSSIEEIRTKCVFKGRVDADASQLTNNVQGLTLELKLDKNNNLSIPDGAFMKSNISKIILPYGKGKGSIPSNFLNGVTTGNNGIVFQVYNKDGNLNNINGKTGYLDFSDCGYTKISSNAFSNTSCLTSIDLDGVTTIGSNAFSNSGMTGELTLPDSIKSIGQNSFLDCTKLTSVTLSTNSEFTEISQGAFSGCTGLTEIIIPSNVKSISQDGFNGDSALKTITFSASSENLSLGKNAFLNCTSLGSTLNLTGRPFEVGESAFSGCNKLNNLVVGGDVKSIGTNAFSGDPISSIKFEKGSETLTINNSAFKEIDIETLDLSNRNVILSDNAFKNCKNLKSISFSSTGDNSIGKECFYNCINLNTVNFNSTITSIGKSAFDSTALTEVDLSSCTKLKELNGFSNCTNLTKVIFPISITSIGDSCFSGCTSLKFVYPSDQSMKEGYVSLPSSISTISQNAFNGCKAITRIDCLADSLTIGNSAFSGCTSLKYFVMNTNGSFNYGSSIFSKCTSLYRVVLPKGFKMSSNTALFDKLTQFANNAYVCLNNEYGVLGTDTPGWMKINDGQNVQYAYKQGTFTGATKPGGYKEWKWNSDKTDIDIITYSGTAANSILFFEAEKRLAL